MKNQVAQDVLEGMMAKANEKLLAANRELEAEFFAEAASRSYYAVFHALSAVLATKGLSFSSHAQTIGSFNREFVKTEIFAKDTTKKLQRLFEDRQTADYDWANTINKEDAQNDVSNAKDIVTTCNEYINKFLGENTRN